MINQITFDGEEVENDCRQRRRVFTKLNPMNRREIEDSICPCYFRTTKRPETESTLNEFGAGQ